MSSGEPSPYHPHNRARIQDLDEERVDDSTPCLNCGEPLGVHVWSQAQASSLCPTGGTEFNPA